jgi:transposase-like protein
MAFGLTEYRRWSPEEDRQLLALASRTSIRQAARQLGRSDNSALGRWFRLRQRAEAAE